METTSLLICEQHRKMMERKTRLKATSGQKMKLFQSTMVLPLLLLFLLAFIPNPKTYAQTCHAKPQAIGGFVTDTICKIVNVQVISQSHLIPNNICAGTVFTIDWGDGSATETYTIPGPWVANADLPLGQFVHSYPTQSVGGFKDSCLYLPVLRITNPGFGTDQLTGIINAWDTEHKTKAIAEIFQVCQNASGTFTFHDGTVFNCLTPRFPGLPNDTMRTEKWEYGLALSGTLMPTPGITIGGSVVGFPFTGSIYRTATSGSAAKPIFVPSSSTGTVGDQFWVRLNIWNYCNPYPGQPAEQVTSYIIVIGTLPPVTVTPEIICQNDPITPLTVGGVGPTYNWYSDVTKVKKLGTGVSYLPKLPNTLPGDSIYWVTQQAGVGGCESTPAVDSIHIYPTLNAGAIKVYQGICKGSSAAPLNDSIAPSGGTGVYAYQWQSASALAGPYTDIVGATASTYAPGAIASTKYYQRKVSSGPCSATTNRVSIIVTPTLLPGQVGNSQSICLGAASATLSQVSAASGGTGAYAYQWYQTTDTTVVDTLIAGAISPTYLPPAQSFTRYFRRYVSSGYCQAHSYFVWIAITPTVLPGVIAGSQSLCKGQVVAAFTSTSPASGGNGTYTYTWQSSASLAGPYAGSLGAGLTYASPTPANTPSKFYLRKVVSGACTAYSDSLSILVTPTLNAPVISANQNICSGATPAAFTSTAPTGGFGGFAYQWYSSPDNVTFTPIGGANSQTYSIGAPLGVTEYFKDSVVSQYCRIASNTLTITVTPTLNPGVIAGSQNLCQGQAVAAFTSTSAASGGNGIYTYTWQSSASLAGPYAGSLGALATYASPTPATPPSKYYLRKVVSGACTAYSDSLAILVTPTLTAPVIAASQAICQGSTPAGFTSGLPTGGFGGYSYQWYSAAALAGPYSSIGGANSQTYSEGPLASTTYYKDSVISQYCRVATNILTVTVTPTLLPGTIAGNANLCQGQTPPPFTSSAAATGGNGLGTYNYQWQSSTVNGGPYSDIAGATLATYAAPAPALTTYYVRKVTSGSCTSVTTQLTVTVTPTLSPGAVGTDQTLCSPGNPAPFTELSAASGGNGAGTYNYQWQDSVSGSPFTNIAGANIFVYSSPGGLVASRFYTRVVQSGFCTVRTNIIKAIVQPTTTAGTVALAAPSTICAVIGVPGAMTQSSAATGGTGAYAYQWQSGTVNGGPYSNITGATASNYSAPAGLSLTTYFVRQVTSGVCPSVLSNQLTVTVLPTLTAGVVGSNQALCGLTVPAPLTELASPNGGAGPGTYLYQWKSAAISNGPWTNIPGATAVGYAPPGLGTTTYYKRAVKDNTGVCPTDTTNRVDIIITGAAPGAAGAITGQAAVCSGDVKTYSIVAIPFATSYTWTLPPGASVVGPSTNNSIIINFTGAASGNLTVTPLNGCGPGPSNSLAITVNPIPVVTAVPDISACPAVDSIKVHYISSVAGSTFAWTNSNIVVGIPASGAGDIAAYIAPTNNSGGVITGNLSVVATANSCPSLAVAFKINVKPTPVVTQPANIAVCPAATIAPAAFSSNTSGETYAWTNDNAAIGLALAGAGNISSYVAPVNVSGAAFLGNLSVKATLNSCVSIAKAFTITVNPTPVVTAIGNITVCPANPINPGAFASNVVGATFNWTNSNTLIGLAAAGSGNIVSYAAPANLTSVNITGTISVTATSNGCTSAPVTFTITIKPTPVLTALGNITVCPTATIAPAAFTANTGVATTYAWTNSTPANGLAASGVGSIASYAAPENLTGASFDGLISVVGTLNLCSSSAMTFHIIDKSRPTVTPEVNIRKCHLEAIAPAAFTNNMAGTTYAWTNTNTSNGLGASGAGNITAYFAPANVTGIVQSGTITVTGTNTSCVSDPVTFLIQVKPTPVLSAVSNITVCPGTTIGKVTFNSNVSPNDTFSWTNTNPLIGLAVSGIDSIKSFIAAANVSGGDNVGTIGVKSTLENCQSSTSNFTITVHPTPVFTSVQPNIAVCPGSAISPNAFTSNVVGASFTWTNDSSSIGLGLSGSGNIASFTAPVNVSGVPFNGHVSATASKNTCSSAPFNFTITVKPKPVVTSQTPISVCPGQAVTPAAFTANTGGGETFNWTNSNIAVGLAVSGIGNIASYTAPVNNTGLVISSTVTVTATLNGCASAPMTFTISIKPTPVINPLGNIAVCPGNNIAPSAFSSNTAGETYAWTNSNISIGLAALGTGSIASYIAPVNVTGSPFVGNIAVTATLNSCVSTVMNFSVTVNPTPVVAAVSNIIVCPTNAINPGAFSSNVAGATFNWTNNNAAIGLPVSGSGNIASYPAPANLTSFNITATISVTATSNGCTSAPVTFTVTIKPTPVITSLSDISVCPASSISPAAFTANTGALTTYAWTNSDIQNGLPASGVGSIASYPAPENLSGASFNGLISVTGTLNSCSSAPMTFHIIVKSRPTLVGQADIVKCPTQLIAPVAFTNNMVGTTYTWTNDSASIGLVISGSGNIPSYSAPANTAGYIHTGLITVTGTNNSCVSDPMTFHIQVKPTPVINSQANISVCPGASVAPAPFTSNTVGETYAWTNSNNQVGLGANGTSNIVSYPAPVNNSGASYVGTISVVATLQSCVSSAMTFTITDKPTPVINLQTDISVCPATAVSPASFVSNVPGSNFNWTNDSIVIGLGLSGVGNIIPYAAPANNTGLPFNGHISVLANANGCISLPMNYTISIKPKPVVTAQANITVCPGQNISPAVFTANTGGGESFNWTNSNVAIGLGGSGAGNITPYVAPANNTGSVISSNVTVTATKNGCSSSVMTFTINLRPTPILTSQSDIVVCKGETIGATFAANTGALTSFAWTNDNLNIGLPLAGAGNINNYASPDNLTGANVTGNISVVGTLNTCASLPMTFHITIKPTPVITHNASISACPGSLISPSPFVTVPAGATFSWTNTNAYIGLASLGFNDIAPYTAPGNTRGNDTIGTIVVNAVLTGCQAVQDTFTITLKAQPVLNQLTDIAVCPGSLISVPAFSSNAPGTTFSWTNNNAAIGLPSPGPVAGNIAPYVSPANGTLSDYKGKITVTGTRNLCASSPMIFNILVHPTPQTSAIQGTNQECLDQNDVYSVTFHATSAYTWNLPGTVTVLSGGGSGYGGDPFDRDNFVQIQFNASGNQTISVYETNSVTGCRGVTQSFTILVNPKPVIAAITGKTDVCLNDVGIPYSVPMHVGSSFSWTVPSGAAILGDPTLNNISVNYSNSGGELKVREVSQAGCVGDPDSILITMHPIPDAIPSLNLQTICNNTKTLFTVSTTTLPLAGIQFDDTIVLPSGGTLLAYPQAHHGLHNGDAISDSLSNTLPFQKTAIYFITPYSAFCTGPSANVTIVVQPTPSVTPSATTKHICNDNTPNIVLNTPTVPASSVTFDYTVVATGGVSGFTTPVLGLANGSQITDILHNPSPSVQTVTYTVTPKGFGCTGPIKVITVFVAPSPQVSSTPTSQTLCAGTATHLLLTTNTLPVDSVTFNFTAITTGPSGYTNSATGLNNNAVIADLLSNFTDFAGTVTYTITPKAFGCFGNAVNDTVTVSPQPKVNVSPPGQLICSGATTNLTLTTPTNPSGVVRFSYTAVADGGAGTVTGFTTPVNNKSNNYSIADVLVNHTNTSQTVTYTIAPTSGACSGAITTAVVTVNPMPVVVATPAKQSICNDNNTNITLTTTVVPNTMVSFNYTASATLGIVTGFTPSVTGLTNGSKIFDYLHNGANNIAQVRYIVIPNIGACSGVPDSILITINPKPTVVTTIPIPICNKSRTNFNISTTTTPPDSVRFRYLVRITGGPGAVTGYQTGTISGLVNNTVIKDSLVNTTSSPQVVSYVITPYGVGVLGCQGDSTVVPVTVYPTPVVTPSVNTQIICSSALTGINLQTPTSPTGSVTFNYTVSPNVNVTGFLAAVNGLTNNTTISDLLVNSSSSPQIITYAITPVANGCFGLPRSVAVTVNPKPVFTPVAPQEICNATKDSISLATITIPSGKVRFNYTSNVTGSLTGATPSDTGLAVGYVIKQAITHPIPSYFPENVTYHITPVYAYTCFGSTVDVVVTVNPTPDITPLVASASICNKTTTNIALTTNSNPKSSVKFNYSSVATGGTTGNSSVNGVTNNTTITDLLNNHSVQSQTVTYTITPFFNGFCVGPPSPVIITVKPTPHVTITSTPVSQIICDGSVDNFKLTTSTLPVDSVRFDYLASSAGGVTGFSTTQVTNLKNNSVISDLLHNGGNTLVTATYTLTPRIFGCLGSDTSVNITVNPTPIVTLSSSFENICSNTRANITLNTPTISTGPVTFDYDVVAPGSASGYTAHVTGMTNGQKITDKLVNSSNSPDTVYYNITPKAAGCIGNLTQLTEYVSPTPLVVPSVLNQSICDQTRDSIVLVSPTLPTAGVSFDYVVSGSASGYTTPTTGLAVNSKITDNLRNLTSSLQTIIYQITPKLTTGLNVCTGPTVQVNVHLKPTPVITTPVQNKETCSGALTSLVINTINTPADSVYLSYSAVLAGGLSGSVSKANQRVGNGYTISESLVNVSNNKLRAVYTVIPTMYGCAGSSITNLIDSVQPVPKVSSSTLRQSICDKGTTNFTLSTLTFPNGTIHYNWTATGTGGKLTGFTANNSNIPFNAIVNETIYNLGSKPDSVKYIITPASSLCTGLPINVQVVVNPTPVVSAVVNNPGNTVCSGSNTSIKLTTLTLPTASILFNYQVDNNFSGVYGYTNTNNLVNNAIIASTLHNDSTYAKSIIYHISPRSIAGCKGDTVLATITVNPFPFIDAGKSDTICSDGQALLSGNVGGSYTSISWYGGAGVISNPSSLSTLYTPKASTEAGKTITLHIKTTDATNICPSVNDSVHIKINQKPSVSINNVGAVCENVNIPVKAIASGNYNKVRWTIAGSSVVGGRFLDSTVLITTYFPGPGETGITTLKITLSDTNKICQDVNATVAITINPLPVVNVLNSSINNQVCIGDPITFTATNALWYRFFVNGVIKQDSSLNSKFTYIPVNGDKVWIGGISAQHCSNNSDTTQLQVNPLPIIHLASSDTNNIVCKNDLVTFTASGAANYKFFVGAPPEVQALSSSTTYLTNGLAIGSNSVYAQGVDTNLCKNYSDTIVTVVRDLPTAVILSKDTAFCDNYGINTLALKVKFTGVGPWTLTWTDNGGTTLNTIDSINTNLYSFDVHPTGVSTTYRLWTVREHNGADCDGTIKPGSMTVSLWDLPTVMIDAPSDDTTAGKTYLLQTTVFGGTGTYPSYIWSGDSNLLDNPFAKNVNFTANINGIYNLYLKVTDSRGCAGRDTLHLDIVITKIIIKLAWDTAEVCSGLPLHLNGLVLGDITGGTGNFIKFRWIGDTTLLDNSHDRHPIFTSNTPGSYKYNFEVTDNIGTKGRDSVTVIVLQNPSIHFLADTIFACALDPSGKYDTITLNGNPTGGTGAYTYVWSNKIVNLSSSTVGQPQFHSLAQAMYPMGYEVTDSKGCKADTNIVVVNEAPVVNFVQPDPGCSPVVANYKINPNNTVKYTWDFNDGSALITDSLLTKSHRFINDTIFYKTFNTKLTGYSLHGCQFTYSNPITIFPKPVTNFTATPDSICSNSRIQFVADPGAPTQKWDFGAGEKLGGLVDVHTFANNGLADTLYPVKLIVISFDNCSDTIVKTVLVHPKPIANFDVSPGYMQYPDTIYTITNNSQIPQYTYEWTYMEPDLGIVNTQTSINPGTHAYHNWGDKVMRLRVFSNYCQDTMRMDLVINPPKPIAKFTTDSTHGCLPLSITFTNHSIYYKNVEWYFGDGSFSKDVSPTYTYDFAGVYNVTLIAKGDGGRDTLAGYTITVYDAVKAGFGLAPRVVIVPTSIVNFRNESENAVRYIWDFGDHDTSTLTDPKHQYQNEGIFDVTLSAWSKDGCFDSYTMSEAVSAKADVKFITPNAFMPSTSGEPDSKMTDADLRLCDCLYRPAMLGVVADGYTLQIFNRWGEILFETHDLNEGWSGYYRHRLCPQDVYVWKVIYKSSTGQRFEKMGTITLYR